jgi:hypothetical protein
MSTRKFWDLLGRSRALVFTGAVMVGVATVAGVTMLAPHPLRAADHLDPPARTNIGTASDVASDIADIFLFGDASTISVVMTFAGPLEAGVPPTYDSNVVYCLHLSNAGDPTVDNAVIYVRFGKDPTGKWGVQFLNVPGSTGPIVGAVQTPLTSGPVQAEAGLFDDPFFFDLQGFNDTKATGKLSIQNNRNFFAGKNDTAMVIQMPRSAIEIPGHPITVWAETRRIAATVSAPS